MPDVVERSGEVGGLRAHWREAPAGGAPVLYLHGVPSASWDWLPFLERTGGFAPDLPGFGSSDKPEGFDYSIEGFDRWIESFAIETGLDRFSLVVHDWGSVGLMFAKRVPERIERLVIFNCVPFLPGYRWHWVARVWQTPVLGELFQATSTKSAFRLLSRLSNAKPGPLPADWIDRFWADYDRATRRAILKLYRASPADVLAAAGRGLESIRCPALILWATRDPYLGAGLGRQYAEALGGEVELEMVENAGHWPWLDRPELIERAARFLQG